MYSYFLATFTIKKATANNTILAKTFSVILKIQTVNPVKAKLKTKKDFSSNPVLNPL